MQFMYARASLGTWEYILVYGERARQANQDVLQDRIAVVERFLRKTTTQMVLVEM